jgi:hypothetical protein
MTEIRIPFKGGLAEIAPEIFLMIRKNCCWIVLQKVVTKQKFHDDGCL